MSCNVRSAPLCSGHIAISVLLARNLFYVARVTGEVPRLAYFTVLTSTSCSQVHEIHPTHAFLELPDRPVQTQSDPDLELASNLVDENAEDGCEFFVCRLRQ